ncbi:terminase large subunit [Clostridium paraputrificum]|uniref:terminase large subunit n=1 Tax=Clostridium paraputrificum TaxID=29363 RepID=UPI000DCFD8E6|nr:terminase TerL endonuclease subunit [Clostridium paraputrificum]
MISVKEIESVVKEHADKQVNYALENAIKEQQEKYDNDKYYFDVEEAYKVFKFMQKLTLDKGKKGAKVKLLKFQFKILTSILCVKSRETGFRRFKEAHLNIGRKNGKGSIVAWIIIYLYFTDDTFGAEYIIVANDIKQATNLFNTINMTIRNNKTLRKYVKITESKKLMYRKHTNSYLRVLANDGTNLDSYATYIAVLDETHEYKKTDAYDKLITGMGLWDEPLMFTTTTASGGTDEKNLEYQMYSYSKKIESGEINDETFYYAVYEAKDKCEIWDVEEWLNANPALGVFKKIDDFIKLAHKASGMKTFEAKFRRLYLNQHVDTDCVKGAIDMELWNACVTHIDLKELKGMELWGGLDLSSKNDITAFVAVFYDKDNEKFIIYPFLFTPGENAEERAEVDDFDYPKYIKEGDLIGTRGKYVNFEDVLDHLYDLDLDFDIKEIGFDKWGSTTIINRLEEKFDIIPLGQGAGAMKPVIDDFENMLIDGKLVIHDNEVFKIMAENVVAVVTDGGTRYSKTKSEFKIDGIIAMLMALILAIEVNGIPHYDPLSELEKEDWTK